MEGMVNDPNATPMTTEEQAEKLQYYAKAHGLDVIIVGGDCDMNSDLMQMLRMTGTFTIVQDAARKPKFKQHHHNIGDGPRNRWGKIK